jgi:hypothetical protein
VSSRRVAIYGSGRTAGELVKELRHSPHVLAAAIVHSAHRAGQDLGTLTIGEPISVTATADLDAALRSGTFDLLLYVGLSGVRHAEAMAACADAGVDMVHACFVHPQAALDKGLYRRLADCAAATGSRIVGTGMIPGLWLDVLPSLLSSGLPAPVSVRGRRLSDISSWGRDVLRHEIGVGSTQTCASPRVDLILRESAHMIAEALNLREFSLETRGGLALAEEPIRVGEIEVLPGQVEGFRQELVVTGAGRERARLEWTGLAEVASRVSNSGTAAPVELHLAGGDGSEIALQVDPPLDPYPGTAARMVRAIAAIGTLSPGLHPTTALPVA